MRLIPGRNENSIGACFGDCFSVGRGRACVLCIIANRENRSGYLFPMNYARAPIWNVHAMKVYGRFDRVDCARV